MVTDSQLLLAADHAENDVSDSQMMGVEEEQMDWGQDCDDLLCQALDEEMQRQKDQNMYGGGATVQQPELAQPN